MAIRIQNDVHLGSVARAGAEGGDAGLAKGAEHIKEVAAECAPVLVDLARANDERRANPGELRKSAYAKRVDDATYEVGFTAYWAAWQHERTDYHHEDGQAKYLEVPMVEETDNVLQIVADAIREALQA